MENNNNYTIDREDEQAATAAVYSTILSTCIAFLLVDDVEDRLTDEGLMRHGIKRLFKRVEAESKRILGVWKQAMISDFYVNYAIDIGWAAAERVEKDIEELRMAIGGMLVKRQCPRQQATSYAVTAYCMSLITEHIVEDWIDFFTRHPLRVDGKHYFNARAALTALSPVRYTAALKCLCETLAGGRLDGIDLGDFKEIDRNVSHMRNILCSQQVVMGAIAKADSVQEPVVSFYLPIKEGEYKALTEGRTRQIERPLSPSLVKRIGKGGYNAITLRIGATPHTRRYRLNGITTEGGKVTFDVGSFM